MTTSPRNREQIWETCVHEAGHAVAHVVKRLPSGPQSGPFVEVFAEPQPIGSTGEYMLGRCAGSSADTTVLDDDYWMSLPFSEFRRRWIPLAEKLVIAYHAGIVAEQLIANPCAPDYGDSFDNVGADRIIERLSGSWTLDSLAEAVARRNRTAQEMWERTQRFVRRNEHKIWAVACELEASRQLSLKRVKAICAENRQ